MSNATPHAHNQGDQQRRRNRGGKNRRNNNNQQGNRGQNREFSPGRDSRDRGADRPPNQPSNTPPRKYAPVKLTWWQKLLKLVGLYKAPARQDQRPARQPDAQRPAADPKVKSNTRNLRSADGEATHQIAPPRNRDREREREREGARPERPERGERPERSRGGDRNSVESPRVYVGNLSYDVSEGDLQDLFKGIGGVRNVEIVYNRATHRSKGYGFVEMLHVDEAKRAVEVLHDQPFMGRQLTVSGAKSKGQDEREDVEEREERQERRPRPTPVAVASAAAVVAAPAVTEESLAATAEIATIMETPVAPEADEMPAPEFGHSEAYFAEVVADPITESPTEAAVEPLDEMVAPAATKAETA
jgi:RNA recognition motif-containing protein